MENINKPGSANPGNADVTDQAKRDASRVKDKVKQQANELAGRAADQAKARAGTGIGRTADEVHHLSQAVDAAASTLREQGNDSLARYAGQLSTGIDRFAEQVRSRDVDDLARDTRDFARNNPSAFVIGSVLIGFGLSRFLKATEQRPDDASDEVVSGRPDTYPADSISASVSPGMSGGATTTTPASSEVGTNGGRLP